MLETPNIEQNYWSRTAIGIYEIGHDNIRLLKWLACYDRSFHENIYYYDLMGSIVKAVKKIFVYAIVQGCKHPYNCTYISSKNTNIIVRIFVFK